MKRLVARMDILPTPQRELWQSLGGVGDLGMVLYGGTAIALRLGHRASVDFDFFSERPLDRATMNRVFSFLGRSKTMQEQADSLTVLVPVAGQSTEGVKVQFFGRIGFGRVGTPQLTEDGGIEIASLEDLMATKLKVVLQRVEAKDYKDIAAMVRAGVDLAAGLAAAQAMYAPTFQPSESLKALTYFEGGDLAELRQDDRTVLVGAVRAVQKLPKVDVVSRVLSGRG